MNSSPQAGLGEISGARPAARQQHHAGQGESGCSGSRRHGLRASDGQRRHDRHQRAIGDFPAQRHAAGRRVQLAPELDASLPRSVAARRQSRRRLHGQRSSPCRSGRPEPDSGDGPQSSHWLRDRGQDRQTGVRPGTAGPSCGCRDDDAHRGGAGSPARSGGVDRRGGIAKKP